MSNRITGSFPLLQVVLVLSLLFLSASGLYAQTPDFTAVALDEFGRPVDALSANPGDVVYIEIQGVVSPVAYCWGAVMVEVSSAQILSVEESYDWWHSGMGLWWTDASADPARGGAGALYYYNHLHSEDNDVYKSEGSSWATAYAINNPEPFLAGPAGSIYNPDDPTLSSSARFYYSGYLGDHSLTRPGIRLGVRIQDTNPLSVKIFNHTRYAFEWFNFDKTNEVALPVAPRENHQSVHTEGNNVWIQVSGPASAKVGDTVTVSVYGELLNNSGLYDGSLVRTETDGITSTLITATDIAGNEWGPESASYQITHASEEVCDGMMQDIGSIPELEPQRCYMTYSVKVGAPPGVWGVLDPSPPDGNNGWYKSQVTVIGKAYDPEDGWLPTIPATYDGKEGVNDPYLFRATDSDGLTGEGYSPSFKQDTGSPYYVSTNIIGCEAGSNGWYHYVSTVLTAGDDVSGVDEGSYDPAWQDSVDSAAWAPSCTVKDNAGNQNTITGDTFKVDGTPPQIKITLSPSSPSAGLGWYGIKDNVTATANGTDNLSGVDEDTYDPERVHVFVEGKDQSFECTVMDKAGNKSEPAKVEGINVDLTEPKITCDTNLDKWFGKKYLPLRIDFEAKDDLSGIAEGPTPRFAEYESEGIYSVEVTAVDNADNKGKKTFITKIDATPPEITANPDPGPGVWYNHKVDVIFTATDKGGSGLVGPATDKQTADTPVNTWEKVKLSWGPVFDNAGNESKKKEVTIQLDKIPPELTVPDPIVVTSPTDPEIAKFLKSAKAKDNQSGVKDPPGVTYEPKTFQAGVTTTVKFTVSDNAGNPTSKESTVTVVKVEIKDVNRGTGLPFSVPPTKNYNVTVNITPSLPSGHNIQFDVINGNANNGTASITVNANRTSSGTVTVTGGNQTKPGYAGNLKIRGRLDGKTEVAQSTGFSVCAHPMGYYQISGEDLGNGTLYFKYRWSSDSSQLSDLDKAWVGEHVSYPGPAPNPPFINWPYINPTVKNVRGSDIETGGTYLFDKQLIGGAIVTGTAATYIATQHYRFHCDRCMPAGNQNNLNWGIILMGPISITRYVEFINNTWRYRITKSGVEATRSLPYP